MQARDKKQFAVLKSGLWFQKSSNDLENFRAAYGGYRDNYATAYDLQGRTIGVASNRALNNRWLHDGVKTNFRANCRMAVPAEGDRIGLRYIDLTEHGINILHSNDIPFHLRHQNTGKSELANISRNQLTGTELGSLTLDLWKAVRLAHGDVISLDDLPAKANDWVVAPGVTVIALNATTEQPNQNLPL